MHRLAWPAAALLGLLVGLAAWWASATAPEALHGDAETFRTSLGGKVPRILVTGSSVAESNVDLDLLAEAAGLPRAQVAGMRLQGSSVAHWYAAWRGRLPEGSAPELVVVVGGLGQMVQAEVVRGLDEALYLGELPPRPDATLLRPLGCAPSLAPLCLREARLRARLLAVVDGVREPVRMAGARVAGASASEARQLRGGLGPLLVPDLDAIALQPAEVQRTRLFSIARFTQTDPVSETLLPELLGGLRAAGSRVALVRASLNPEVPWLDTYPEAIEESVREASSAAGALWVSPGVPPDPRAWSDPVHLDEAGARWFTGELVAALRAEGLLPLAEERP